MTQPDWLAARFEESRPHLRTVAYRMLGSLSEADDVVQEAWLRLSRADTSDVENLRGWLTRVVSRVCLDHLRARKARSEEPMGPHVPDPLVAQDGGPEHELQLADSVGLALLVVLETLAPAERLAFVLHDLFAVPFDDIAAIVGRTPTAARQLASRARRRVQGAPVPDADLARQREVVAAFLAASREGNFEGLLAVLDPDVVLRSDLGGAAAARVVRGATNVAQGAMLGSREGKLVRPAIVNGAAGVVVTARGRVVTVVGFTVVGGKIVEMNVLADPARLRRLALTAGDE
ncbi:MAG: RNA polymerase sigma factor SigJ [Gemmatimonadales bacterium]